MNKDSNISNSDLLQQEYNYSTEKILENFSNYSAFHHRTQYILPLLFPSTSPTSLLGADVRGAGPDLNGTLLAAEFELVENAVFTEPDDQSAWYDIYTTLYIL